MGLAIKTGSAEPGINVHLLDVIGDPPARDNKPPPLQLTLSYLVTAWSDDGKPADDLLLKAAFAAMKDPSLEVILAPTAVELWRAFELAPRAAFLLRVPVRVAQVVPRAKPVTSTKFVTTQVRPVTGVVVDHLDRPLMDATVELIGLGRTAKTDRRGRFALGSVAPDRTMDVRVRARETEVVTKLEPAGAGQLKIIMQMTEE